MFRTIRTYCLLAAFLAAAAPATAAPAREAPLALFDACHAETCGNANWSITGGFSDFADTFRHLGFRVEDLKTGPVTPEILARCTIFVVGEPNSRFTDDEERALVEWVRSGGSLYLIADHTGSDRNNDGFDSIGVFNRFTPEFGFTFEEAWIKRMSPIPVPAGLHEVFRDVPAVGLWGGTVARVTGQAARGLLEVKYKDKTGAERSGHYLVVAEPGRGRVVALGDSSPYDDGSADGPGFEVHDGYNLVDHGFRQLSHNTIAWLARRDVASARIPFDLRLGGAPLNTSANTALGVPFRVIVQPAAAGTARVDYYLRAVGPDNLLGSRNVSLKAGENDISFDFKYGDQGLFRLYADIVKPGVAVPGRAFTTVKVGRIPRLVIDRSHENDWTNRFRAFSSFLDDEGIFKADARKDLALEIGKPDVNVLVMSAPKKGVALRPEAILAVIELLKRDGALVLVGTSDSGQWGDTASLKPLVEALNLPVGFNDDTVLCNDPAKNSSLVAAGGLPSPVGEAPCSLVPRAGGKGRVTWLAYAPEGSTNKDADGDGCTDWSGRTIPVDARVDLSTGDLGAGRVLLYGSCHLSDWCFKPELAARTVKYVTRTLRDTLSAEEVIPISQILASYPEGLELTVSGLVKAFDGRSLVLEDAGRQMVATGAFPAGFAPRVGSIVKIRGRLMKAGGFFNLAVTAARGR